MMKTATANASIKMGNVRSRIQSGIENRWMDGVSVIVQQDGKLDAIPGAYLNDISYTENPLVLGDITEWAEDFLSMSDDEILGWANEQSQQAGRGE
jgi:hypothetical protein